MMISAPRAPTTSDGTLVLPDGTAGITDASNVYLQIGNQRFPASYAGPAPGYVGLQQINIPGLLGVRGFSGVLCAGLCSQFFEVPR